MDTAHVKYLGGLRTEAVHLRSGSTINTDAPIDNHGKGEAFSPTDLMSTSLACCMMTLMGIAAEAHKIDLNGLEARVVKHMAANPRRVDRIELAFTLNGSQLDRHQRELLEHAARTCPVAMSLGKGLAQEVTFSYK
ncbi:MAG TPA: OsmC family protein [Flavobacteriales bacterium]|nr:OsmC family protein [Flavobacteriales bacterium]HRN36746.1 OsmC family protein [Flavobacteriales bacterium]HRO38942.1 OsmC family protein [Flavobacteriales bacterium]HRP80287.1 OsmC family protein [Flavobacteriales bacterium]HRQ85459.1 OsmC family protein [Flavobacteriales bacterium]